MGDVYDFTARRETYKGRHEIPSPVYWMPDDAVITEHVTGYVIPPGMALRDMPCIVCDKPLSGIPVKLITLAAPWQCETGLPHLEATTVARHDNCPVADWLDLAELIIAKAVHQPSE